jgi:hypothetical protein
MIRSSALFLSIAFAIAIFSCSHPPASDSCCIVSELPNQDAVAEGEGLLEVDGSTSAQYFLVDAHGRKLKHQRLNHSLSLPAGQYQVAVNGSVHMVSILAGHITKCSTGTLIATGKTADRYEVTDSSGQKLADQILGKPLSLFPGKLNVRINHTDAIFSIKAKELTEIRTGSLLVRGSTDDYYYVVDKGNEQLNFARLEKATSLLPGTYQVKVNNTSMKAEVLGAKITELHTGCLIVNGLTEEYYYVTDSAGQALNFQILNKPIALFPGKYSMQVNNSQITAQINAGEKTELNTGGLTLTGGGSAYYYVFDDSGKQLNYNVLNKTLSFFPSEYTVKLGPSARKISVIPGQLTSIEAFN